MLADLKDRMMTPEVAEETMRPAAPAGFGRRSIIGARGMRQGIFPFARASYLRYLFLSMTGNNAHDHRPPLPHPLASQAPSAGGLEFVEKPRAVALAGNLSKNPNPARHRTQGWQFAPTCAI